MRGDTSLLGEFRNLALDKRRETLARTSSHVGPLALTLVPRWGAVGPNELLSSSVRSSDNDISCTPIP
jgi:hypothetical protein